MKTAGRSFPNPEISFLAIVIRSGLGKKMNSSWSNRIGVRLARSRSLFWNVKRGKKKSNENVVLFRVLGRYRSYTLPPCFVNFKSTICIRDVHIPKDPNRQLLYVWSVILRSIRIFLKIFFPVSIPPSPILFVVNQWSSSCVKLFFLAQSFVLRVTRSYHTRQQ